MPKYVVSTTLRDPEWNNTTVIDSDPVAAITRLKEQDGKDIVQYGFGRLSYTMLDHGLLDELRLWVHPSSSAPAARSSRRDRRHASTSPTPGP